MLPRPHPAVLFQPVDDGAILLHTEQEIYFGLNGVGAQIWGLLPPACRELDEVCARLQDRYPDVPPEELRGDVMELLDTLTTEGLLVVEAG